MTAPEKFPRKPVAPDDPTQPHGNHRVTRVGCFAAASSGGDFSRSARLNPVKVVKPVPLFPGFSGFIRPGWGKCRGFGQGLQAARLGRPQLQHRRPAESSTFAPCGKIPADPWLPPSRPRRSQRRPLWRPPGTDAVYRDPTPGELCGGWPASGATGDFGSFSEAVVRGWPGELRWCAETV